MKKLIFRTLLILISIIFMMQVNVFATIIVSTDKEVDSGSGNVTISVTSKQALGSYELKLTDTAGLELVSSSGGEISSDKKTITGSSSTGITNLGTYTFKVPTVTENKTYNVKFLISKMETTNLDVIPNEPNTAVIKVKAPAPKTDPDPLTPPTTGGNTQTETPPTTTVKKSSEARLSNLGINPNDFRGFRKDIYEYSVTVPNGVSEVDVYAEKIDAKASIKGTGKVALKEGANTVDVIVTAEDGKTTKTYKLKINRRTAEEENAIQSEARLSELGIKPEEYDFKGFDKDKTEYSVEIPSDVEEIEVYAEAVNSNCQITGIGMITLEEGDNTLTIDVISENGTKKTYTIKVTRKEAEVVEKEPEEKFGLSNLSIIGLTLSPKFDGETYEYKVDLTEDLTELEIKTEKTDKDSKIEIIGNENLQEGENVITILVKNEETEEVATYQIIVNKVLAKEEAVMSWLKPSTWGKEEYIKIALIIVLIILIISAIILKIQIGKENKKNHEIDFPGAEALDKAIAEHQELAEEEMVEAVTETHSEQCEFEKTNYLEDIAKQRLEQNENSNVYEDDFAPTTRRRRRRD